MLKNETPPTELENGAIYFFYRLKVKAEKEHMLQPIALNAIQRFYIILKPKRDRHYRLLFIGKKALPKLQRHEKYWGRVDLVTTRKSALNAYFKAPFYVPSKYDMLKPELTRCGEGHYSLMAQNKKTYLSYKLTQPKKLTKIHKIFHIALSAHYQISIKNQARAGATGGQPAAFPATLIEPFKDLRFFPVNPTQFLNYAGAEVLIIDLNKKP